MGTNLIAGHMRCVILVYSRLYLFLSSFLFLRHVLVNGSARKNLGILKPKVIEEKGNLPKFSKSFMSSDKKYDLVLYYGRLHLGH